MDSTHTHFHYLQQKLQEWKANDLLFPPLQLSWMRFQEVATRDILPVLHEACAILEAEGWTSPSPMLMRRRDRWGCT